MDRLAAAQATLVARPPPTTTTTKVAATTIKSRPTMRVRVGECAPRWPGGERIIISVASRQRSLAQQRKRPLVRLAALTLLLADAFLVVLLLVARQAHSDSPMNLPDGIEHILGFKPRSGFRCERDGYFGDTDNDCRIFHLCQRDVNAATGRIEWRHWTYACGNQTMFNQLTLTCAFVDEAIPCKHASQFQYLNEVIHKPAEPFLTDADVTSGVSYYSNRIMSDGARARAFQDSQLLAQLGGQQHQQHQHQQQASGFGFPEAALASSGSLNLVQEESRRPQEQQDFGAQTSNQRTQVRLEQASSQAPQLAAPASVSGRELTESNKSEFQAPQQPPQQALLNTNWQQFQAPVSSGAQNSFEFSIATDHRQFGAPASSFISSSGSGLPAWATEANVLSEPPSAPPGPQASDDRGNGSSTSTDSPAGLWVGQFGPTPQADLAATTASAASPVTTTTSATPAQTTSSQLLPLPSSTLAPTVTSTQRLQLAQPTQATTSSLTTSSPPPPPTTTTTTTTTQASVTRQSGALATGRLQPAPGRRAAGSADLPSGFDRAHAGFQSTRLSSLNTRRSATPDTPLVMRRNTAASSSRSLQAQPKPHTQPRQQLQQAAAAAAAATQARPSSSLVGDDFRAPVAALAGGDFWRRASDVQLVAPRFESLLMRRRV